MKLLLMRHADAASAPDTTDHDRPLSQRGESDAVLMGRWLRDRLGGPPGRADLTVDMVLCSSAARARRTWELVSAALASAPEVVYLREIYHAGPDEMLHALAGVPSDVASVAVVGHNPTVTLLGRRLTDGEASHFPAGAVAVIEVDGSWTEPTGSRLLELVTPESVRAEGGGTAR